MKQILRVFATCAVITFVATNVYAGSCPVMSGSSKSAVKSTAGTHPAGSIKAVKSGKTPSHASAMMSGTCPMSGGGSHSSKMDMSKCPEMGKVKSASKISAVCPVHGKKIPSVTKNSRKSVYKGKAYYFCGSKCKPVFDKNPGKFVKVRK